MDWIFWLIGGLCLAAAVIVIAAVRSGDDRPTHPDPYDGEGW